MPVDLPEGLRWKIGPTPPGVAQQTMLRCYLDGKIIGHMRWLSKDYKRPPGKAGEITYVFVDPEYQRRGIATKMLEMARREDPRVHHSNVLTGDGTAWSQAVASKTSTRRYHGSGATLSPGTELVGTGGNYQPWIYTERDAIYVTEHLAVAYFYAVFGSFSAGRFDDRPYVYEVDAVNPRGARAGEETCESATVIRDVTEMAKSAFRGEWESTWKPMILREPVGGIPTPAMIVDEFERVLGIGRRTASTAPGTLYRDTLIEVRQGGRWVSIMEVS